MGLWDDPALCGEAEPFGEACAAEGGPTTPGPAASWYVGGCWPILTWRIARSAGRRARRNIGSAGGRAGGGDVDVTDELNGGRVKVAPEEFAARVWT